MSTVHLCDKFVISCGTVPVDITKRLALLIYYRPKGEFLLPKGRKDVNEELCAAALRETFEETGYVCEALPLRMPTLATGNYEGSVIEPVGMTQRDTNGVRKIIFWYAGKVDSTQAQAADTQKQGEDFESVWVPIEEAVEKLSFFDDKAIAEIVLKLLKQQEEA